ncbi:hypothetical protein KI440_02505 [Candidatus Saccharibacteria bacterium TM7i]|nr:hypothetical protein KI440_02505 [Candidatus Saccharibacteria bacterium TM7i]
MGGYQDELARKAREKANQAKGTPEYDKLAREADAREADVNDSLRRAGQNAKY